MGECDLRNVCRTCLTEEGEFQSILVPEATSGLSLHLSEMVSACTSVQITLGDGLPEQICSACVTTTVNVYLFKLKCEESDRILKAKLNKLPKYPTEELQSEGNEEYIKPETTYDAKSPEIESVHNEFPSFDFDSYKTDNEEEEEENVFPECTNQSDSLKDQKEKAFECEICQKKFSRNDLLLRHKIAHAMKMEEQSIEYKESSPETEDDVKLECEDFVYSCPHCDMLFGVKNELESHLRNSHKKREYRVSCEICQKKFVKMAHLNKHLKSAHFVDKQYKCPTCEKVFPRSEQLRNHVNGHTGLKPHICDICFKGFNQISNLKDHMRTHNGEKPFLCSTCGKGFNQLGNLRQHTVRHSGVKAHLCSTCGNGFASKGELSAHLRKHTGARPFVCNICNHGFTTSSSLTKHKRIHSGEKPYECDTCKMKFSRSGILARHKRTHTGEKPYKCKFCGKAFSQSNDLTSHLRIHTGEKPFICDQCGQAFRQSSALKTHKKIHVEKSEYADVKPIVINGILNSAFIPF